MLAGTDWTNVYNLAANIEDTRMDALGTVAWQRSAVQDQQNHPEHVYEYEPGTSRVSRIRFKVPDSQADYINASYLANDTTSRGYDASGNAVSGWKRGWQTDYRKEESRSYYGAGDRVAAVRSYVEIQPTPYMANRRGSLVEYRYDALGRRVLVRTTRDGVCVGGGTDVDCTSGIERFVYAGDNVLWEMRGPGKASSTPAELDQAVGTGQEYGVIGYTHAGGVDRPLAAYKLGVNAAVIAPHTNWRGEFSGGTYLQGSQSTAPVSWPGYSTTAWYQGKPPQEQNRVYMGTVLEGQRDASGQIYKRNRMYDPQTGQFTQTDPIGIAGGLNTYGFAAGDPVSYADPYGLCAKAIQIATDVCPGGLTIPQYEMIQAAARDGLTGGARNRILSMLDNGLIVLVGRTHHGRPAASNWFGVDHIQVTAEFFTATRPAGGNGNGYGSFNERAWVLAHELGHLHQAQMGTLIYESGTGVRPNAGRMMRLLNRAEDDTNPAQIDANRYACAVAVDPGAWQNRCPK